MGIAEAEHDGTERHWTRREMLRAGSGLAAGMLLPRAGAAAAAAFHRTERKPYLSRLLRAPEVAAPTGSTALTYDIFDNHWCLSAAGKDGLRRLLVLPAQAKGAWVEDSLSALPPAAWRWLVADEEGRVWAATEARLMWMNPQKPSDGWQDVSAVAGLSERNVVTAMGVSPELAIVVACSSGVVELGFKEALVAAKTPSPAQVDAVGSDREGRLWVQSHGDWWVREAANGAWQRSWEVIARLPGGNHDLTCATVGDSLLLAGGQTAGWGYPAKPHVFDEVLALDAGSTAWRSVGRLRVPRFFNAIVAIGKTVWVIGGYRRDEKWAIQTVDSVEVVDLAAGTMRMGPPLPEALLTPVAAVLGERIYVAGAAQQAGTMGRVYSLGGDETAWRREKDAPVSFGSLAGAAMEGALWVVDPKAGLCRFDAATRGWTVVETPRKVRSPQVAAWKGEIWVLGGRDIADPLATQIYAPATNRWRSGPAIPHVLAWGAAGILGDRLTMTGGADGVWYNNRTLAYRGTGV